MKLAEKARLKYPERIRNRVRRRTAIGRARRQRRGLSGTALLHFTPAQREHLPMDAIFQPGQLVRVNLAGLDAGGVTFQAAVTDAVGHILKQTSEQPPKYLVELLFSFRGVSQVEVPADRIHAQVTTGKMGGT